MAVPTWEDILDEVKAEYDLNDEVFTSDTELLYFANEAIEDIEKEIHSISDQAEKYFHAEGNIALVSGTSEYDLPTDIYANKITGIYYNDGGRKYEIKPIKDLAVTQTAAAGDEYRYRLSSSTAGGTKLKLYPASAETSSTNVTIFYRRQAVRFVDLTDELDVPEAKSFIKQFIIDKAANKERMTPDAPESPALARKRKALLDSLENQIDDNNNEIAVDNSHYEESV